MHCIKGKSPIILPSDIITVNTLVFILSRYFYDRPASSCLPTNLTISISRIVLYWLATSPVIFPHQCIENDLILVNSCTDLLDEFCIDCLLL